MAERRGRDAGRLLLVASLVLAIALGLVVLFAPTGTELTVEPGVATIERSTSTWSEIRDGEEDVWVALVAFVPAVLVALALALDWTRARPANRIAAAVLVAAFVLVAGFSVGLFFLPVALTLALAALATDGHGRRDNRAPA